MASTSKAPEMSPVTEHVVAQVKQLIPPLLDHFHKGQLGRVGVIGGSEDYTGAPYFSAMASARLGCDMSHVICTPAAAAVIKTYSPNLMVHPLMRQSPTTSSTTPTTDSEDQPSSPESRSSASAATIAAPIIAMLPRLHVLVIGPGLGRDALMQETVALVITAARKARMPIVLDADALLAVQKDPGLIRGYELAVLTPNVVEFGRLCKALEISDNEHGEDGGKGVDRKPDPMARVRVRRLALELGKVTVVQKGEKDYISNGEVTLTVDTEGGKKRSGGQGDTLTGAMATFLGWRKAYHDGLWEHGGELSELETVGLAAFGGCLVTRECSRRAFMKKGRSLQASDLTDELYSSFMTLFGEDESDTTIVT